MSQFLYKNAMYIQGFQEIHHFEESRLLRNNVDYISLESYSHEDPKCMLTFPLGSDIVELSAIEFSSFCYYFSENGEAFLQGNVFFQWLLTKCIIKNGAKIN
jgi:hypothetical protein